MQHYDQVWDEETGTWRLKLVEVPGTLTGEAEIVARARLETIEDQLRAIAASSSPNETQARTLITEYETVSRQLYGPIYPGPKAQRAYDRAVMKKFKASPPTTLAQVTEVLRILMRQQESE